MRFPSHFNRVFLNNDDGRHTEILNPKSPEPGDRYQSGNHDCSAPLWGVIHTLHFIDEPKSRLLITVTLTESRGSSSHPTGLQGLRSFITVPVTIIPSPNQPLYKEVTPMRKLLGMIFDFS